LIPLRTLIVQSDSPARDLLRSLLAGMSAEVSVAGEAEDGRAAAHLMQLVRPEVLFLDAGIRHADALTELLASGAAVRPAVIYTTPEVLTAADGVDAVADSIVPPFDEALIARAIDRARGFLMGWQAFSMRAAVATRRRLALRVGREIVLVRVSEIDWIEAEGNYMRVHLREQSYLLREPLQSLSESLPATVFMRVHRSAIVNIERVRKLVTRSDGSPAIVLSTGQTIPLGPGYRSRLHAALGVVPSRPAARPSTR
jgi:two-component system LytT family response regulator